jgi:hypothetical protein
VKRCTFLMQIGKTSESEWGRLYSILEEKASPCGSLPFHSLHASDVEIYEHNGNLVVARILADNKLLGGAVFGDTDSEVKNTIHQLDLENYISGGDVVW